MKSLFKYINEKLIISKQNTDNYNSHEYQMYLTKFVGYLLGMSYPSENMEFNSMDFDICSIFDNIRKNHFDDDNSKLANFINKEAKKNNIITVYDEEVSDDAWRWYFYLNDIEFSFFGYKNEGFKRSLANQKTAQKCMVKNN